jgi:PAS domain S-box-containing protein
MPVSDLEAPAELGSIDPLPKPEHGAASFLLRHAHRDGTPRVLSWQTLGLDDGRRFCVAADLTADRSAREEADRLRLFLEHATDAVILFDEHLRVTGWSRGAERLFGYAAEEMLGGFADRLLPPEYPKEMDELLAAFRTHAPLSNVHTTHVRKDGSTLSVSVSTSPVRGERGEAIGSIVVIRDVTAQLAADQRMRASEARYRQLFESAHEGIWVLSPSGETQMVNRRLAQLLTASADELRDHGLWRFMDETMAAGTRAMLRRLAEGSGSGSGGPREVRLRRDDGRDCWMLMSFNRLEDERGECTGIIGMLSDIAEFKQAEVERAAARQLLWAITESMPEGLLVFDASGVITFANGPAHALLGWSAGALPGRMAVELLADADADADVLAARASSAIEQWLRRADGGRLRVEMTLVDNRHDAGARQRIMVFRDVSDRHAAARALAAQELAERANAAKSEFLSRMSHELRTPLNAILGFGQLLAMADLEPTSRANVTQITAAGRHLLGLIDEVLDISRIESGNVEISLEPVAVVHTLEAAVALTKPLWKEAGIEVAVVPPVEELHVWADQRRLSQVLLNLISNAIKYNRPGGSVRITAEAGPEELVTIRIADTGHGIDSAQLHKLFQPFQRLGAERTRIAGTGLGLAVTKAMLEAMRGTIDLHSSPGTGTEVTISLDACEASAQASPEPAAPELASRGPRVLCIEDNPANVSLIEQVLALDEDIELIAASSGRDGIALARAQAPDLVLLDLDLREESGVEVLESLRGDGGAGAVPVIVISASGERDLPERVRAAGAVSHLTKPLDIPAFLAKVHDVIEAAHAA